MRPVLGRVGSPEIVPVANAVGIRGNGPTAREFCKVAVFAVKHLNPQRHIPADTNNLADRVAECL